MVTAANVRGRWCWERGTRSQRSVQNLTSDTATCSLQNIVLSRFWRSLGSFFILVTWNLKSLSPASRMFSQLYIPAIINSSSVTVLATYLQADTSCAACLGHWNAKIAYFHHHTQGPTEECPIKYGVLPAFWPWPRVHLWRGTRGLPPQVPEKKCCLCLFAAAVVGEGIKCWFWK